MSFALYPSHYRTAFAFSAIFYPHSYRRLLRGAFPTFSRWELYGLTTFRLIAWMG